MTAPAFVTRTHDALAEGCNKYKYDVLRHRAERSITDVSSWPFTVGSIRTVCLKMVTRLHRIGLLHHTSNSLFAFPQLTSFKAGDEAQ